MKNNQIMNCFILSTILAISHDAFCESKISIETDPSTFAMKGDSLLLKYAAQSSSHLQFGIGTYSLELPKAFIDINSANKNKGWQEEIARAVGLFGEYYFESNQTGWFVGAQMSQQKMEVKNERYKADANFKNGLVMLNLGYRLPINDTSFYVVPWAGVGYTTTIEGKKDREAIGFDVDPFVCFLALHVGYSF